MTKKQARMQDRIRQHGENLLRIFPEAKEQDPVKLCKKLRRLEADAYAISLQSCNGPDFAPGELDARAEKVLGQVNRLLGNINEYQPKTGAKCGCRRGVQRDNCPNCEGTGYVIDFRQIRNRRPLVPIFLNCDARGYAIKIDDEWMKRARVLTHDGQSVYIGTEPEAWIHKHHSYSFDHACKFEGYAVEHLKFHSDWGGYGILAPDLSEEG